MTDDPEAQTDLDILAFVNGQLDGASRFAVMAHLARHPDRAAAVMADLQLTEGLRLALDRVETPAPPQLLQAAARLSAALAQQTARRRWLPFAAAVALFAAGWGANGLLPGTPPARHVAAVPDIVPEIVPDTVLDTALDAQDAVALRAALGAGPMAGDTARIAARLGIDLPALPQGWIIRSAQVVATPERPGLALVIDTPDLGEILLFGVLRSADGPDAPARASQRDGRALAFFERDRTAFVLVDAAGSPAALRQGAETLRHRFN